MPPPDRPSRGTPGTSSKLLRSGADVKEQCGLEVPRQLQWHKWQAGGEFIKALCIKNVSTQVMRVSYKLLPSSSAFSVDFPEAYKLSPGMVANIKVYFRPSKRQSYTDQLELLCGSSSNSSSSIWVPLEAVLPASKLQLPPALDFGCVPAKEQVVQQLPIKNVGDAPLRFSWKLEAPFAIVPAAGQLMPGHTMNCEVLFDPQEAAAYRASAACSLDNGELLTVQINGMAKFPFLSVETSCLDFGNVVVGLTAEGYVRFGNHSAVPAHFSLLPSGGSNDAVFNIQPVQGTLQPNSYSVLHVVYSPKATGTFSCQSFSLSTPGGNKVTLVCQGTAVGPQLRLSSRVFNFGNVKAGQAPSKVLYLENCSDVPLAFEFLVDPNGVFMLTKQRGVVPPRSMTHTALGFKGVAPSNYWQRIVCLVKDSEPIAIDALATCYDDNSRPPPLMYKHIAGYLERVAAGEQPVPAAGLSSTQGPAAAAEAGSAAAVAEAGSSSQLQLARLTRHSSGGTGGSSSGNNATMLQANTQQLTQQQQQQLVGPDSWQLLFDGVDAAAAAVTVSDTQLDFGSCSRLSPCEARSFSVNNNTGAKLLVSLIVPGWQDPLGPPGKATQVFQAFPESLELRPHSSGTIRLAFRPPRDGLYYCQGLMLLAGLKAMRSFRLVQEGQAVVPPWCIGIMASGNTFAKLNPEFSPKVSLSASSVNFPPCGLGDAVHQTLALHNNGDTPVHFRFAAPSAAGAAGSSQAGVVGGGSWFGPFGVLPSQGVLEPKSQHLVALRFKPCDLNPAQLKLTCVFNNMPVNSTTLMLSGCASEPQLSWDVSEGQLFFRPTCVGASSQRVVTVNNVSRVSVGWQWVLSKKLQEAVSADPMRGVLRGYDSTKVTFSFNPTKQQIYNARAALLLLPSSGVAAAAPAAAAADAAAVPGGPSVLSITAAGMDYEDAAQLDGKQGACPDCQEAQLDSWMNDAEKLILNIVGEATRGALSVEPSSVSFGVVHVGYIQRRTLSIINQSNGVLRYSIELVDDAPEGVDRSAAACEFGSATAALLAGGGGNASSAGCGRLQDCWVDEADGVVNARASKNITLTLLPRRRGEYKLRLNLRANPLTQLPKPAPGMRSASAGSSSSIAAAPVTPDATGATGAMPAGLVAIAPSSPSTAGVISGIAYAGQEKLVNGNSSSSSSADIEAVAQDKPPLATVAVAATASFPSLLVTDVFCQGLPKQVAWQMLGIQQLNAELASPVTSAELQAQALSDKGSLTNDNAAALLPPFEFDLGLLAAGCAPRSFWVQLSAEGELPVNWELHSYDTPEVELENWVEPARPLTQAEKERSFVIDNAIFELHPRSGRLQPGTTQLVCFSFRPVAEGSYQLPLFLRIKDGKQLQLQLSGCAVPPSAQLPLAVRGSQSCVLAAAPLGELEPPLQCYTLRNGGPAPLQYRLDTAPLQQLARQNYGAEVIKYAGGSPLAGEIPPGDVAVFNWLFQPLEAKLYSVVLPLSLGPAPPQPLLLRGRGYHPLQHPEHATPTAEEAAQRWQDWVGFSAVPGQAPASRVLRASQEVVELGVCLPASTTRRLLVLQNAACVPLAFVWDVGVFDEERAIISGRLAVVPATGVLEPGESRVCQVSFQSGLQPQIFSGEIFCYARHEPAAGDASYEGAAAASGSEGGLVMMGVSSGLPPPAWEEAAVGQHGPGQQQQQQQQQQFEAEQEEEIIAQHPERPSLRPLGLEMRVRNRLPLHLSMTEATRHKFELLDQQYTKTLTLQKLSLQQHAATATGAGAGAFSTLSCSSRAAAAAAGPAGVGEGGSMHSADADPMMMSQLADEGSVVTPQLLTVTVQGCVLDKGHIKAGSYIPAAEQQAALKLLSVSHLLPAVEHPVSLLLPPGSMGPSAAAAAAAADREASSGGGRSSSGISRPAVAAAAAGGGDLRLAVAGAVLQEMLGEVWADGEVAAAFEHLEPAPVPVFAQVKQQQQQQRFGQQRHESGKAQGSGVNEMPAAAETAAAREEGCPGGTVSSTGYDACSAAAAAAASGGEAGVHTRPHEAVSDAGGVLSQPEFQAFADFVLDNALVGILQEGVLEQEMQQQHH